MEKVVDFKLFTALTSPAPLDFGDFDPTLKKKKKKKTTILDDELGDDAVDSSGDSWLTSERDYTYEEVSPRVHLNFLNISKVIHSTNCGKTDSTS